MTMLDSWADQILADPLATARAAPRAIGYLGFDLPEDLLAATGAAPAHLPWDADRPTPNADAWVEGSFAPWARSIAEDWAAGAFDFLEYVLFSRGDDSAQRLYYYLTELQRRGRIAGPKPLILDVARIRRPTSLARSTEALRRMADTLRVDADALRAGIAATNDRRRVFDTLGQGRAGPGARYERIARASLFAPVPADGTLASAPSSARRLLLAGTAPPDDRLHRAVEAAGWTIVGEAHDRPLDRLGPELEPADDPFAAVAARLHEAPFGPRSFADPSARLIAQAQETQADAVLLWLIEQEESIVWHVPSQAAALERAGLPALVLTRRAWNAADGAIDEIGAWLAGLAR